MVVDILFTYKLIGIVKLRLFKCESPFPIDLNCVLDLKMCQNVALFDAFQVEYDAVMLWNRVKFRGADFKAM